MSQPWETISTKCLGCGRKLEVPAARRRRAWRLGHPIADFCGKACSTSYIAKAGKDAQESAARQKINQ